MSVRTLKKSKKRPARLAAKNLSITPVNQVESNWCWAACAEMVTRYYGENEDKCEFANELFGLTICCITPDIPACNSTASDPQITGIYQNHNLNVTYSGQISAISLVNEIEGERPVEIGWTWSQSGGGHVVLVTGYDTSGSDVLLTVIDPAAGAAGGMYYSELQTAGGAGVWDATWSGIKRP